MSGNLLSDEELKEWRAQVRFGSDTTSRAFARLLDHIAALSERLVAAERERDEAVKLIDEADFFPDAASAHLRIAALEAALRNITNTADPGHARDLARAALTVPVSGVGDPPLSDADYKRAANDMPEKLAGEGADG